MGILNTSHAATLLISAKAYCLALNAKHHQTTVRPTVIPVTAFICPSTTSFSTLPFRTIPTSQFIIDSPRRTTQDTGIRRRTFLSSELHLQAMSTPFKAPNH